MMRLFALCLSASLLCAMAVACQPARIAGLHPQVARLLPPPSSEPDTNRGDRNMSIHGSSSITCDAPRPLRLSDFVSEVGKRFGARTMAVADVTACVSTADDGDSGSRAPPSPVSPCAPRWPRR